MNCLHLYSEPFSPTGNIAAEGFRKLLGRPALGLLQTVLREALQNSIDASTGDAGPVVMLRVRNLREDEAAVMRQSVLSTLPPLEGAEATVRTALEKPTIRVLEICDFGTRGLAGPTRADAPVDEHEMHDFVNFLRNVGSGRDTHQGGGTYGYGKTSLYALSSCSTIIVDSLTTFRGEPVRRFIACHLGSAFDAITDGGAGRRFTGRHWWGYDDNGTLEPLTGEDAVTISEELGLPLRAHGDSGTSIMILDPYFDEKTAGELGDEISEAVLWNFWPRMVESTAPNRRLTVMLVIDGVEIEIPAPEVFPPLDLFASAMAMHRNGDSELKAIKSQRPAKDLGKLAICRGARSDRRGSALREGTIVPRQSCQIALMRPVELVVKYLDGDAFPDGRYEWAGVFICSDEPEVEAAFASAEPPAHDDWMPRMLPKGPAKTWVGVALSRLQEIARTEINPAATLTTSSGHELSVAAVAARMGRLLTRSVDTVSRRRQTRGGPKRGKGTAISAPRFVRLKLDEDGKPVAVFEAHVQNDGGNDNLAVNAEGCVVLDGSTASGADLPDGYDIAVVKMEMAGLPAVSSGQLVISEQAGRLEVLVPTVPFAAVSVRLWFSGAAI